MRRFRAAPLALFFVAGLAATSPSQSVPRTLAAVPIFPGAVKVEPEGNDEPGERSRGHEAHHSLRKASTEFVVYSVAAAPEAVYSFYQQRLASKAADPTVGMPASPRLSAGEAFGPHGWYEPYEFGDHPSGNNPAVKRATLTRARKPVRANEWVQAADFEWSTSEGAKEYDFAIHIQDYGLSPDWKSWTPNTRIVIARYTYDVRLAVRKDREPISDVPVGAGAPTEATLGVRMYPGAVYDSSATAQSREDGSWVFGTNDEVEKVVAFYESQLKKKATQSEGAHIFVLAGDMSSPSHAVAVVRSPFPGRKTAIFVRRAH